MRSLKFNLLVPVVVLLAGVAALAQAPDYNSGIGRAATPEELKARDLAIGPAGKELPPGHGTAKEGVPIFAAKCAVCHGPNGEEAKFAFGRLVGGRGSLTTYYDVKTTESYWPYATTIWGFIREAMPEYPVEAKSLPKDYLYPAGQVPPLGDRLSTGAREFVGSGPFAMHDEGLFSTGTNPSLTFDQIYALTAFILFKGHIIKEDDVMDQDTLPKVQMPNRFGFSVMDPDGRIPVWHSRDPKMRIEPHVAPESKPLPPGSKPVNVVP